jgi:hypothetical protein
LRGRWLPDSAKELPATLEKASPKQIEELALHHKNAALQQQQHMGQDAGKVH